MKEKIIHHPELGEIHLIRKRGIRRLSIKVGAERRIRVTIPWLIPFAAGELFLKQSEKKIHTILRRMESKSNWGSCSAKGNINLNIRLHLLPPHLRDYVILHELCHLRHLNHGPEFHRLLESLCPLHLELKKELGKFSIQQ